MTLPDLRRVLDDIAAGVHPADLYDRSLVRSRSIGRRRTVLSVSAAAVAVVLVAVTTWQFLPRRGDTIGPTLPSPTTADPTLGPTPTPAPRPSNEVIPPAPDLTAATVTITRWPALPGVGPCPTGPVTFTRGEYSNGTSTVSVGEAVTVWAGTAPAFAAVFRCFGPAESGVGQLLAFRMDGTPLVTVIDTATPNAGPGASLGLGQLTAEGETITVEVILQTIAGSAPPTHARIVQRRSYRFEGYGIRQVAGPTGYVTDPSTSLEVTAGALTFGAAVDGCRTGTVLIEIRNVGPRPVTDVAAALIIPDTEDAGDACPADPNRGYLSYRQDFGVLAPGQTRKITVTVRSAALGGPYLAVQDEPFNLIDVRVGPLRYLPTTHLVIRNTP